MPSPSEGEGCITRPRGVLASSQYWPRVLSTKAGVVVELKLRATRQSSGKPDSTAVRVMVFPDPGGPHRTTGAWDARQARITSSWRKVSVVGTTTSDPHT